VTAKKPLRITPRWFWRLTDEMVDAMISPSRPRWTRTGLRVLLFGWCLLLWPFLGILGRRHRNSPVQRLDRRADELWKTSPHQALTLFYDARARLVDAKEPIEIAPFGRFDPTDKLTIEMILYDCELALGRYEEALELARGWPGKQPLIILQQVDCLLAMKRREEAITLLEASLPLDDARGRLRQKLAELTPVNRGLH